MSATPVWFGRAERPLFGWLHSPLNGLVRGAVVLCPPVGVELSHAHYTVRLLAKALQEAGYLVVRFDYDGTGQSAGLMNDPGRVAAWLASIGEAVVLARSAGAEWVGGIGLRLGATLLANAVEDEVAVDALALWDPCTSGRVFLREQRGLAMGLGSETPPAAEELPGYRMTGDTIADIRALTLPDGLSGLAPRVLVAADPTRDLDTSAWAQLRQEGVDWLEYPDDRSVFDIGEPNYRPPYALVDRLRSWVEEVSPAGQDAPVALDGLGLPEPVAADGDGAVIERTVSLGSNGMFGIETLPASEDAALPDAPTLLFLTVAAESSIGPARQWVELARRLARAGVRSVRFDLSGLGDSPPPEGEDDHVVYAHRHLSDVAEAARAVSGEQPRNVILVGMCSGAWVGLRAAPLVRPVGVVALNPYLTYRGYERRLGSEASPPSPIRHRLGRWLRGVRNPHEEGGSALARARERIPPSAWRLADRLGAVPSPTHLIAPAVAEGVHVVMICGAREARPLKVRTPDELARYTAGGSLELVELPTLHHSLLGLVDRVEAVDRVAEYVAVEARARRRLA